MDDLYEHLDLFPMRRADPSRDPRTGYRFVDDDFHRMLRNPDCHSDMSRRISDLSPHYSDTRFSQYEHLVWGNYQSTNDNEKIGWDYSDRLRQWDYEKSDSAWATAKEKNGTTDTAQFYQDYLTAYFDRPIKLVGIISGVNRGNGYPYRVYGYRDES